MPSQHCNRDQSGAGRRGQSLARVHSCRRPRALPPARVCRAGRRGTRWRWRRRRGSRSAAAARDNRERRRTTERSCLAGRTWPSPHTTHLVEVSSRLIGPRAQFLRRDNDPGTEPELLTVGERGDALTMTTAASTRVVNSRAAARSAVMMASGARCRRCRCARLWRPGRRRPS